MMLNKIRKKLNQIFIYKPSDLIHGNEGVKLLGHRNYVGGKGEYWDLIGKLQYDFLLKNGLKKDDVLLDVACGSLRLGVHLIPYLNKGNYLGIDKEKLLIELGLLHEIDKNILKVKKPEFVISNKFEFHKFSKVADYAIAQSLFTHLPPPNIHLCLSNLKGFLNKNSVFFATFFLSKIKHNNFENPHDHKKFSYTKNEIIGFGNQNGWKVRIIGDWHHPRKQIMVEFTLR